MEKFVKKNRRILSITAAMVLLPSVLVSSLWMTNKRLKNVQRINDVTGVADDKIKPRNQIVYLNRLSEKAANRHVPSQKSRYGSSSSYSQLQVIKDPVYKISSYDTDYYSNQADPYLYPEDMPYLECNKHC
ncbi:hypothetical protein DAPPUDRAFT_320902 [Daphnia pulex]|uniref:Uncharacterized protein n=1 Tax=Daphnia pulex TaxID=6669 RepID=E9GRD1_DAPPU|nr:hypothetical protein DAPPUDRAFT_320902 [Daphnia pulex]|eukprot:EFX78017.1 hypothetical protein DAPPUDRAFT_320902 [Daphnia pulex]